MSDQKNHASSIKHRIMILSGKGGVGKTTVSVNLACALAQEGYSVGLLDTDIHGPNIAKMLGISDQPLRTDENEHAIPIKVFHHLKIISIANLIPADQPVIWRGPMKMKAIQQLIHHTQWGDLDFLIVDSPPGTGDEPLSVIQELGLIDGAIIVTTPQEVSIMDAHRSALFVQKMQMRVLGIIENMSHYVCPDCEHTHHLFGTGGGAKLALELGCPLIGQIPLDAYIPVAGDHGKPPVFFQRGSLIEKVFVEIAGKILNLVDPEYAGSTDR